MIKDILRFITCGSVDDGKSTLLGCLLYESKNIFDDHLMTLGSDSKQYGTQGEMIDFALLLDGLQAEREQGITIDVAYRFFSTEHRNFIAADVPGHEQYTCNMATGASKADLAVILIDARKGILTQTRRHTRIIAMMGISHVVLAINKMDLVNFQESIFQDILLKYQSFAVEFNFANIQVIPISALKGDNVLMQSIRMPWYTGPSLMTYLTTICVRETSETGSFIMPVQWVNRPNSDFRGFCGRITRGKVRSGDDVRILPSGIKTQVKQIVRGFNYTDLAEIRDSVTLLLTEEVDVSRGDVIVAADDPLQVSDQFEVKLLWMMEQPMLPGRSYLLKLHTEEVNATITDIKYCVDINSGAHLATKRLMLNDIAVVNLSTSKPVVFEPYLSNHSMGGFILVDKFTLNTVGAGMINFALRRASNIHWQALEINQETRAAQKMQKACCIWFTGLSGSGKSTIANLLEKRLHALGKHTYILDGDNIRHALNRDLGFTEADRVENIRRVAEVAKLMVDAGLIVLVSFISPFKSERQLARNLLKNGEFIEVFVDTPLEVCEKRDPKGLYAKARRGELENFTGVDSQYEPPEDPEYHLCTVDYSPDTGVEHLISLIKKRENHV